MGQQNTRCFLLAAIMVDAKDEKYSRNRANGSNNLCRHGVAVRFPAVGLGLFKGGKALLAYVAFPVPVVLSSGQPVCQRHQENAKAEHQIIIRVNT
jgi:hypothetical protein